MNVVWLLALLCAVPTMATAGEPVFPPSVTERPSYSKPFWIDRSMFLSDDYLFVVGVASRALSLEEGRSRSLEVAKAELKGRAPKYVTSEWREIETKELYEEREADGTYTVYRLIMVKTHDYSAMLIDKSKAEEVAAILSRIEERKQKEHDARLASQDAQEQNRKRAMVMGLSLAAQVAVRIEYCKQKDYWTRGYQEGSTEEGRRRSVARVWEQKRMYMTKAEIEREVDSNLADVKRRAEDGAEACQQLKEADIEIAAVEAKNPKAFDPHCRSNCYSK